MVGGVTNFYASHFQGGLSVEGSVDIENSNKTEDLKNNLGGSPLTRVLKWAPPHLTGH